MDIKEIALRVAVSLGWDLDQSEKEDMVDFAQILIAEIQKQNEPIAWMSSRNGFICKENKNPEYNVGLFTFPPSTEAIRLAQEAGLCQLPGKVVPCNAPTPEILMEFAQLVENNALKKAAKVCSDRANNHRGGNEYREDESRNCEAAILALIKE